MRTKRRIIAAASVAVALAVLAAPAGASHSWGNYHWARTSNPFTLKLGDNVDSTWDAYLSGASADWSQSAVLDTSVVAGSTTGRRCRAATGRVEVCNAAYGSNGWLGLASIWASGDHITQGTVKVNDTYFKTATYNTTPWRNMVMCQEVGHTFGLDHQDETQTNLNLGSCMDYTNNPAGGTEANPLSNEHPNTHDYDQLVSIYAHLDSTTTVGQTAAAGPGQGASRSEAQAGNSEDEWGQAIRYDDRGRPTLFVREAGDERVFTFVIWAD